MTWRIKFKRLDKTARHIMHIDKKSVEEVKATREIPEIKPGYIVQLRVEVPENTRRVTTVKGIVIAKRNAGLNSAFRIRRLVVGVGIGSLFLLNGGGAVDDGRSGGGAVDDGGEVGVSPANKSAIPFNVITISVYPSLAGGSTRVA
ncbi:PREDICTED: 50S ribosomal protein L19, chloroplastic-like [Erythranthe guttata]|uniref:50S ribosomal protein L19, chloroplastic-like n=1 Tax=Erythranthe guttata TaxID=4155 RepID=UPI00064DF4A0|nr:PREDICTED: 50S ribosomal protein L19, chloroplastic-like [Erythranthe guttata]|eukprot:XP_012839893.1 PREDICTED: 50S ribosomal protein L19, chloroplastic-like [Erythranthe guttata]